VSIAAQRYAALENNRSPFLNRARDCALLTIPFIAPPSGTSASTEFTTPYQSLGARGVRTLGAKLLLALFPNTPFFKYAIDDLALGELSAGSADATKRGEIEKALNSREKAVTAEMGPALFRPVASVAFQHLLVTGNFLLYTPPEDGRCRGWRLDQFVVNRSPDGQLIEFCIKERVAPSTLSAEILSEAGIEPDNRDAAGSPTPGDDKVEDLYTYGVWDNQTERWLVHQELNSVVLESTKGEFEEGELPYTALRLNSQPGESYGRAYVEEFLGDLDALEGLTQSIVEGSAAASRVIFFVAPNGVTELRVVAEAENLDVVAGNAEDISTLQSNKQQDLSVAMQQAQAIAQGLAYAFLMNAAVQRSAERVTAEEIRYLANELDTALGGMYTLLAAEFQMPIVRLFEKRMEKRRKAPPLPKELVSPVIVTGLEALGRGADQQNMKLLLNDIIQMFGHEAAAQVLNIGEFISRAGASYGVDMNGLIKTPEEQAAAQQQAQMMQMVQQLGPNAINQLGGTVQTAMRGQPQAAPPPPQG